MIRSDEHMRSSGSELDERTRPMYVISIVADILNVHPQTLRTYEKEGLITPCRQGGQRLYSRNDVERLGLILDLTRNLGVNRAGVDIILRMRRRLEVLQAEVETMMDLMHDDVRDRFQDKIRKIFEEEA